MGNCWGTRRKPVEELSPWLRCERAVREFEEDCGWDWLLYGVEFVADCGSRRWGWKAGDRAVRLYARGYFRWAPEFEWRWELRGYGGDRRAMPDADILVPPPPWY